jgi:hypothetical protein
MSKAGDDDPTTRAPTGCEEKSTIRSLICQPIAMNIFEVRRGNNK